MVYISDSALENDATWYEQLGNAATKGLASAVASGIIGTYNTGVALSNSLGTNFEKKDSTEFVGDILGTEVATYYRQNQGAIDSVGFMISSLIPGSAAVKAVRAGQKSVAMTKPATALGQGLRALSMPNTQVTGMYRAIRKGNNSLSQMTGVRAQLYAGGMRQAAIESLAFETAAVLTNNQNTALNSDNLSYFDAVADNVDSIAFGTVLGAGIGGVVSGITEYKKLRIGQAKTDMEFKGEVGTADSTLSEAAPGDNLALQVADFKLTPQGRETKGVVFNSQVEAANQIKREKIRETLLAMIPETLDKKRAKGDSTMSQVVDDMFEVVTDPKVASDDLAKSFALMRQMDYAGKPTKFDKNSGINIEDDLAMISNADKPSILKQAWDGVAKEGKENIVTSRGKLRELVELGKNDQLDDAGWKAAMTYGSESAIKDLLFTTDTGMSYAKEIFNVIGKTYPKLNLKLNSVSLKEGNLELGKKLSSGLRPDQPGQYLGIAMKAIDSLPAKELKKYPRLAKLFDGNSIMQSKYVRNEIFMNTRTREFSVLPTSIRSADLGEMKVKSNKLFYGTDGSKSVDLKKVKLDIVEKTNVSDMTAHWAASQRKEFLPENYLKQGIEADNLPVLTRLLKDWEDGAYKFNESKPPKVGDDLMLNPDNLRAHIFTQKQNMLSKLLETKKYSTEELAEILDVKVGFVARYGVPDKNGYDLAFRNGNYGKTENVRLTYDAADYDRTLSVGAGMADVERRLATLRTDRNLFASRYFGAEHSLLPKSSAEFTDNFNAASGITTASSTQTLVKASQAEDLSEVVFQGIGKFTNVMRTKRTEDIAAEVGSYASKIKQSPNAIAEVSAVNTKLAQGEYGLIEGSQLAEFADYLPPQYLKDEVINPDKQYLMPSRMLKDLQTGEIKVEEMEKYFNWHGSELGVYQIKDDTVGQFFRGMANDNFKYASERNQFKTLVGEQGGWNEYTLPALPLDISKTPELATVRFTGQEKFGGGKALIAARNSQELQEKIRVLRSRRSDVKVEVLARTEKRAQRLGDYDTDLAITESTSNPDLRKLGVGWDVLPEADPKLVDDFMATAIKRRFNLDRQVVKAKYSEEFKMLELEDEIINPTRTVATDSVQSKTMTAQRKLINQALGLQNYDEYKGLRTVQEKAAQAMDLMYANMTGAIYKLKGNLGTSNAKESEAAWDNLTKVMDDYDLPKVYQGAEDYIMSTSNAPREVVSRLVAKSNGVISALMLRADYVQPLVSAFSTPITLMPELAALKKMVGADVMEAAARSNGGVKIPGVEGQGFFSNYKVVAKSMQDLWQRPELLEEYRKQGLVGHTLQEIVQSVENISVSVGKGEVKSWESALQKAGKILTMPSDKMDEVTRFLAARSTERILDDVIAAAPAAMAERIGSLKYSIMNSVITKTHGNYIASQRPTLFQGWGGQAVGLFQTYQFNLLQAAGRHISDGNSKQMMQMMFYQSGFFGVQSLPGFQLMNNHIAEQSKGDIDIYTEMEAITGKDAAEFLLYGGASQLTAPVFGTGVSFFTRGDMTPRTPILIPASIGDVPIVSFATKMAGNFAATIDAAQGSLSMDTVWQSLAHNGINRPLAGLGQVMLGEKTTLQGATIYDYDEVDNIALHSIAKLMGTTTMDEALAMNSFYRAKNYQSARQVELNEFGTEVKSAIRAGEPTNPTDFMMEYAERGGDYENFNRWYQNQASQVNDSAFDEMRNNLNSPEGRYLMNVMGSD